VMIKVMIKVMNLKKWKGSHSSYDIGYKHYKLHLVGLMNLINLLSDMLFYLSLQSIDYKTFNDRQLICSESCDITVCVYDVDNNKQIQLFDECPNLVNCVTFSSYHYNNNNDNKNNSKFVQYKINISIRSQRLKRMIFGF
ncbi:hypothetical protein RFI_03077, partial [Reticulomyxa filosa]